MKRVPAQRVYSGHMKLDNVPYNQNLEDPTSTEFQKLADDLEEIVSLTQVYAQIPRPGDVLLRKTIEIIVFLW